MIAAGLISKLTAGALAAAMLAGAVQTWRVSQYRLELADLEAELTAKKWELRGCAGRLDNLITDLESDNEIDNLSPNDLRTVPRHWLLRPDDGAGAG